MEIVILLAVGGLTIIVAILFYRRGTKMKLSKDDAEVIVMRRFRDGKVVGARFVNYGNAFVWEFDVFESGWITRVRVDANTAAMVAQKPVPAVKPSGPPLGQQRSQ